jgi:hypothetical protein
MAKRVQASAESAATKLRLMQSITFIHEYNCKRRVIDSHDFGQLIQFLRMETGMAKFTVRVELHDGEDYNKLHEEMKREGFTKTIIASSTGIEYELPMAEYNIETDRTKCQVLNAAKRAANKLGVSFSVLVTKSAGRTWYNLD